MNKENRLFRVWCKVCEDFTLHAQVFVDEIKHPKHSLIKFSDKEDDKFEFICNCGCQYTDVLISNIDKDKLLLQRARYKEQRKKRIKERLNLFAMMGVGTSSMFETDFSVKTVVVESDAGLKDVEKREEEKRIQIKALQKAKLLEFKNVKRNDICLCGSNLKYKKCCLPLHETY